MTAPAIPALPSPPSRADDPTNFSNKADAFLGALPGWSDALQALGNFVEDESGLAETARTGAQTAQSAAAGSATAAAASATSAATSATASASSASAALASQTSTSASAATAGLQATAAITARNAADASAASAAASLAATLTAAGLSGARAFATFALANASLGSLTVNQVVFVATDETLGNVGTYYQYNGTALVFLRAQEFYTSPSAAVPSDSTANVLTKLLVAVGLIPAAAPTATFEF